MPEAKSIKFKDMTAKQKTVYVLKVAVPIASRRSAVSKTSEWPRPHPQS